MELNATIFDTIFFIASHRCVAIVIQMSRESAIVWRHHYQKRVADIILMLVQCSALVPQSHVCWPLHSYIHAALMVTLFWSGFHNLIHHGTTASGATENWTLCHFFSFFLQNNVLNVRGAAIVRISVIWSTVCGKSDIFATIHKG